LAAVLWGLRVRAPVGARWAREAKAGDAMSIAEKTTARVARVNRKLLSPLEKVCRSIVFNINLKSRGEPGENYSKIEKAIRLGESCRLRRSATGAFFRYFHYCKVPPT
jgi:hypothetical protein